MIEHVNGIQCQGGTRMRIPAELLRGWKSAGVSASAWNRALVLAIVFGPGALYPAGCPAGAPADKPAGIDAILAYEGTWDVTMEHFDTAHSKASREHTSLRNDCWKSGGYVACNQYVDGDSKVLLVFIYNQAKNEYTSYQIPPSGGDPGSGRLLIDGNVWTFPWQTKDGDSTTYFRVVNVFPAPGRIESRQEFSTDNVHWTVMAKGTDTKTSAK
jgi:hypothetical protein